MGLQAEYNFSATGVYMRGMWTLYPLDSYTGANTTIAYSDNMASSSGATGQTVATLDATMLFLNPPMCFKVIIVTGSCTSYSVLHGVSTTVYPPTRSAFRGVLTATKM